MIKKFKVQQGFTLIELIVVFSIVAVISIPGLAAFVSYSRSQAVQSSVYDLATIFQVAKSKAQSQVTIDKNGNDLCGTGKLSGYQVQVCNVRSSPCVNRDNSDYELNIICDGTNINGNNPILSKKLPAQVSFGQLSSETTVTSFLFYPLTGAVNSSGKITITGYSNLKTIQIIIDAIGNIRAVSST